MNLFAFGPLAAWVSAGHSAAEISGPVCAARELLCGSLLIAAVQHLFVLFPPHNKMLRSIASPSLLMISFSLVPLLFFSLPTLHCVCTVILND